MSQYNTILSFYENAEWICQRVFWDSYIRSPHKRRAEMLSLGYRFEDRPCEHGLPRSKDYKLIRLAARNGIPKEAMKMQEDEPLPLFPAITVARRSTAYLL